MPKKQTTIAEAVEETKSVEETAVAAVPATVDETAHPLATTGVAGGDMMDTGLEALEAGDMVIPRISIGQERTPDIPAHEIGKYRNNVSGDAIDRMNVVFIKFDKSRLCMPQDYSPENKPLCRSGNFATPDEIEGITPLGTDCTTCEYAKWGKKSNGKPKPPQCNELWNVLSMNTETGDMAWQSWKSTALTPAKGVISALAMRIKTTKKPMWFFTIEQTIAQHKSGAFIPAFHHIKQADPDMCEIFAMARAEMAGEVHDMSTLKNETDSTGTGTGTKEPQKEEF